VSVLEFTLYPLFNRLGLWRCCITHWPKPHFWWMRLSSKTL